MFPWVYHPLCGYSLEKWLVSIFLIEFALLWETCAFLPAYLPACFGFYCLFVLFFNVRQSLCIVMTGMEPQNPERSTCLCLQSSKIKGMGHHTLLNPHLFLETNVTVFFPFKAKLVSSLKSPSYRFISYHLLGTHLNSCTSFFFLNKDVISFWDTKLSDIFAFKLGILEKLWEVRCASRESLQIWSL